MQGLHRGRAGAFTCALGLIVWSCSSTSRDFGEPQQIEDQDAVDVDSTIDASGNVMLVWSNPLGVWATRFE
jgi:hypothetical protein